MQRLVKILAFGLVSGISISQAATLKSVYTDLTDQAGIKGNVRGSTVIS